MDGVTQLVVIDKDGVAQPSGFGAWLAAELERKHLSQADLAARMGVKRPNVNRWVHDQVKPSPETITRISLALEQEPTAGLVAAGYMDEPDDLEQQVVELVRFIPKERLPDALRYLRFLLREHD